MYRFISTLTYEEYNRCFRIFQIRGSLGFLQRTEAELGPCSTGDHGYVPHVRERVALHVEPREGDQAAVLGVTARREEVRRINWLSSQDSLDRVFL